MDAAGLDSPYTNDWYFEGEAAYICYMGKQIILPSYSLLSFLSTLYTVNYFCILPWKHHLTQINFESLRAKSCSHHCSPAEFPLSRAVGWQVGQNTISVWQRLLHDGLLPLLQNLFIPHLCLAEVFSSSLVSGQEKKLYTSKPPELCRYSVIFPFLVFTFLVLWKICTFSDCLHSILK